MAITPRTKGYALLALITVELAFWPIFFDIGSSALGMPVFLFYSFSVSTAILAAIVFSKKRYEFKQMVYRRKTLYTLAISGFLNAFLSSALLTLGILHTSASLAGVVYRSWPLLMVPFIPLIVRTKVNKYQIVSLLIGFVALYIALTQGRLIGVNLAYAPYILLLFFAALAVALSNVLIKSQNADVYAQNLIFDFVAMASFFALVIATSAHFAWPGFNALMAVLFTGGIAYSIGSVFFYYSLKVLEPTVVGNAMLLVPFLTFAFSAAFLGEQIYFYYIILGFVIVLGIIIQRMAPSKVPERVPRLKNTATTIFDITSAFADNRNPDIYSHIAGSGRALAVKGRIAEIYDMLGEEKKREMANKYGCIMFTNRKPHASVAESEIRFMGDVLGLGGDDAFLVGIGEPSKVEEAINEVDLASVGIRKPDDVNEGKTFT